MTQLNPKMALVQAIQDQLRQQVSMFRFELTP
jgi:hypothetical protein